MDSDAGWWCDRSCRKIPVDPNLLRPGQNTIMLTCAYDETHPGLEIVYLLGAFGTQVKGTRAIVTAHPTQLQVGDWVKQGLAFYSGSVSYCRTVRPSFRKGERVFVRVPEYRGMAVRVLVNGVSAGITAWEPNEVEITDLLNGESAALRIEVLGHRRNSHGPLHHTRKWLYWTGPSEFTTSGDKWTDNYQLVPCGLMKPPELVVKR